MKEKFLPIGTVVTLKGGTVKLMIVGFCAYGLSAFAGGYFSAAMFKRWQGKRWILQLLLSSDSIFYLS